MKTSLYHYINQWIDHHQNWAMLICVIPMFVLILLFGNRQMSEDGSMALVLAWPLVLILFRFPYCLSSQSFPS